MWPCCSGLSGLSAERNVDDKNDAAYYFSLQKWVYSGIAENCYLGQAHCSKRIGKPSKQRGGGMLLSRERGGGEAALEEPESSGADASHWLSLLLGKEKIFLLLG